MSIIRNFAVALIACAAQAGAAQPPLTARATLVAATSQRDPIVADGGIWTCADAICTGPAGNGRAGDQRACRALAKQAGPVAAYLTAKGELTAEELASCNKGARPAR